VLVGSGPSIHPLALREPAEQISLILGPGQSDTPSRSSRLPAQACQTAPGPCQRSETGANPRGQ
jgi:hypothetical protein